MSYLTLKYMQLALSLDNFGSIHLHGFVRVLSVQLQNSLHCPSDVLIIYRYILYTFFFIIIVFSYGIEWFIEMIF
ncbi:hypothetical protein E2C01_005290 [Portunus trituberculatus]|uniref:Uncharacterized protein n=1 Tax=Portunus trituberculatus TaxID=210409 RepID=A0A5B7CS58_PORTR|nr:hypothetical protein [Portunus trituberculatus]